MVASAEVEKGINKLSLSKFQPHNDINTEVIKDNQDIFSNFITHN